MRTVKNIASQSYEGKQNKLNLGLVATGAFFSTLMVASSIVQATDLQIYAAPTAGKKTIVMMLDTSGSMAEYDNDGCYYYSWGKWYYYGRGSEPATVAVPYARDYCLNDSNQRSYTRLTRLKDGMFAFLNSTDPSLTPVKVGLGNYSAGGDGRSGQILVPAEELGGLNSAHRLRLKDAIKGLTANNGTPTAHAYAEAAAYLMGTNTVSPAEIKVAVYKRESYRPVSYSCDNRNYPYLRESDKRCYERYEDWRNQPYRGNSIDATPAYGATITDYYKCSYLQNTNFNTGTQSCYTNSWTLLNSAPSDLEKFTLENNIYYKKEMQLGSNADSGFAKSHPDTKESEIKYKTPLPAPADRQSCDGQGVYILSDGAANSTSDTKSSSLMAAALGTYGDDFNCSGGLTGGGDDSGWNCMGEFAKKLFNKSRNPAEVSIQTAFVGFGNDMNNLGNGYVENACRLSSRTQSDRTSDDTCSPTKNPYGVPAPGYGNGGFFIAKESAEITRSVIQFIDNIGKNPIDPLSTGAISVPVDALSPHTFQPYGYLRAMEPKPGTQNIIWMGNLKKYNISNGALKSKDGSNWVFNTDGTFNKGTQDFWNTTGKTDDAGIDVGGAFANVILPTAASPAGYRPLFSDIKSVAAGGAITGSDKKTELFLISRSSADSDSLLNKFKSDSVLKNLSLDIKLKLLNYFGYDLNLTSTLALPSKLDAPTTPFNAMGASIHSFPVQMTYSGELDANGDLKSARKQSVLYGSMEGALRVLDASTGAEQMVFVPSEILKDTLASKALRKSESDTNGAVAGIGGAWIVDSDYQVTSESTDTTSVSARKMNVYGGMRMGGKSYYGLDMLQPTAPKFLFKITGGVNGTAGFERMGQTWSKPVLANIRYNNKITRVMIVGGGYDMCYENPRFTLNTVNPTEYGGGCKKAEAEGNAVYIINADTGERIWWASNKDANINNTDMKHSIVSRIATLDRDGDGLVDNLYFGDLGGQIFRADLNNAEGASLGKRVVRLANLAANTDGTAITNGDQPRFYQPPTLTVHDEGKDTFLLVGIASGDRSTPLDVAPEQGREKMLPYSALTNRPTNKVYGLIDRDVANKYLITGQKISGVLKDISLVSENISLADLKVNPQLLTGKVAGQFSSTGWKGWYRSLSSGPDGIEIRTATMTNSEGVQVTTTRTPGGLKAFEEEPIAMTGRLLIPVYDPQGTGIVDRSNPCQPRIVGETNVQQFCLPYGACLKITGDVDKGKDSLTGFQMEAGRNKNVLGAGIRGLSMGPTDPDNTDPNKKGVNCGALTILGLQSGKGKWECNKILNPTRWYEKYVEAKNN